LGISPWFSKLGDVNFMAVTSFALVDPMSEIRIIAIKAKDQLFMIHLLENDSYYIRTCEGDISRKFLTGCHLSRRNLNIRNLKRSSIETSRVEVMD
jgi:hypothetical protein